MKRTFVLTAGCLVIICLALSARSAFQGSAQAARSGPAELARSHSEARGQRSEVKDPRPEGLTLGLAGFSASSEGQDPAELFLARLAHDSAVYLLEKAQRQPGNRRPLEQAAQHLRACLSHEPTTGEAGPLFREARQKLEEIEKRLALVQKPTSAKVEATPQAPSASAGTPQAPGASAGTGQVEPAPRREAGKAPQQERRSMVGPDGVPIRRAR
jgi:hypothetical protein